MTAQGELASGAVLIEKGVIVAAGRALFMAIPAHALLVDAEGGLVGMAGTDGSLRAISVGAPADIICRSKFGHTEWVMKAGHVVYPPNDAGEEQRWRQTREDAIGQVIALLSKQPEHRRLQRLDEKDRVELGFDLIWTFQTGEGITQRVNIRVVPTLTPKTRHIFVLDRISAQSLPEVSLGNTRAHWWFYVHTPDRQCYCIPTEPLKRWLLAQASTIPLSNIQLPGQPIPLKGWAIDVHQLQSSLTKIRTLPLPASVKKPGKKTTWG